jgi:anti-sigma B factor antagonist
MEHAIQAQGKVHIVSVSGSLDALTAPELADAFATLMRDGHSHIVADLRGLEYTSSAGLRVLLGGAKAARQQSGDLRLAGVQPNVAKVLELSGLNSIIKSFPDVPAAVSSFA